MAPTICENVLMGWIAEAPGMDLENYTRLGNAESVLGNAADFSNGSQDRFSADTTCLRPYVNQSVKTIDTGLHGKSRLLKKTPDIDTLNAVSPIFIHDILSCSTRRQHPNGVGSGIDHGFNLSCAHKRQATATFCSSPVTVSLELQMPVTIRGVAPAGGCQATGKHENISYPGEGTPDRLRSRPPLSMESPDQKNEPC